MFRVLIESGAHHVGVSQGSLVSIVTHAAMFALALLGGGVASPPADQEENPTKEAVYLIPLDRMKAPPPQEHSLTYTTPGVKAGNEGTETKVVQKEAPVEAPAAGEGPQEGAPAEEAEAVLPSDAIFDSVATVLEVDSAVARHPESAAPSYPPELLAKLIEGGAFVQFIVDTTGHVDTTSFKVVSATHPEFAEAVRRTLPAMRFSPAIMHSRKVRQLVEQPFMFKIVQPAARTVSESKPPTQRP